MSMIRTRWAAAGAAVAIMLGAGGIGLVNATISSGDRTVFVPITPCRIMDTRPGFAVGSRTTPLGADETYAVDAHGTNGECTLPTDAVGLALNVTAIDATLGTFLAIWGEGTRPNASSLNPQPGQPPTPNAVTTELTTGGQFNIFNKQGTVNVFVDVVGYYADHNHDDLYYTRAEADAEFVPKVSYSVSIHPADMQREVETSNWVNSSAIWLHSPASASHECIIGPVALPAHKSVVTMSVVYTNAGAAQSVFVSLKGIHNQPGPIISATHDVTSQTVNAPSAADLVELDIPVGGLVRTNHNYSVVICAQDQLIISGVHIGLGEA